MSEKAQLLTGRQLAAGRVLLGLAQADLAAAANISVPTLRRMEASEGVVGGMINNVAAVRDVLEAAGVEFLSDQQGRYGVLSKNHFIKGR